MWVNVLGEYADLAIYDVVDELLDMVREAIPLALIFQVANGRVFSVRSNPRPRRASLLRT